MRLFRNMTGVEIALLVLIVVAAIFWVIGTLEPDPTPADKNQIIVVPDDEGGTGSVSNLT